MSKKSKTDSTPPAPTFDLFSQTVPASLSSTSKTISESIEKQPKSSPVSLSESAASERGSSDTTSSPPSSSSSDTSSTEPSIASQEPTTPHSRPWHSYICTNGSYSDGECGEVNVTQDEYPGEKAFFTCDRCERQTWQRRSEAPPERPIPENAYITVTFAQVRFARAIHVAMSNEARAHLKRIAPRDVVLTLEELLAIKEGLLEVPTQDRPLRLVEAINYFANEQKVPELAFYGSAR